MRSSSEVSGHRAQWSRLPPSPSAAGASAGAVGAGAQADAERTERPRPALDETTKSALQAHTDAFDPALQALLALVAVAVVVVAVLAVFAADEERQRERARGVKETGRDAEFEAPFESELHASTGAAEAAETDGRGSLGSVRKGAGTPPE